jgi:hypothetical protein
MADRDGAARDPPPAGPGSWPGPRVAAPGAAAAADPRGDDRRARRAGRERVGRPGSGGAVVLAADRDRTPPRTVRCASRAASGNAHPGSEAGRDAGDGAAAGGLARPEPGRAARPAPPARVGPRSVGWRMMTRDGGRTRGTTTRERPPMTMAPKVAIGPMTATAAAPEPSKACGPLSPAPTSASGTVFARSARRGPRPAVGSGSGPSGLGSRLGPGAALVSIAPRSRCGPTGRCGPTTPPATPSRRRR